MKFKKGDFVIIKFGDFNFEGIVRHIFKGSKYPIKVIINGSHYCRFSRCGNYEMADVVTGLDRSRLFLDHRKKFKDKLDFLLTELE